MDMMGGRGIFFLCQYTVDIIYIKVDKSVCIEDLDPFICRLVTGRGKVVDIRCCNIRMVFLLCSV